MANAHAKLQAYSLGVTSKYIGKVCKLLQRFVGNTAAHRIFQGLAMFASVANLLSDIQDAWHLPDITDTTFINCTN